jgi:hypothetical protein
MALSCDFGIRECDQKIVQLHLRIPAKLIQYAFTDIIWPMHQKTGDHDEVQLPDRAARASRLAVGL